MPGLKRSTFGRCHAASLIALTLALCMTVGCDQHRDIVGKWRLSGSAGETVWEFSRNGSVLVGNKRGIYRFGDQGRIKIETPFEKSVYLPEFSGDRMTLRGLRGTKLEFTRISENKR
jgi:hypothetical protein